jgi:hypothetical protein
VTPDTRLRDEVRRCGADTPTIAVGEAAGEGGYLATALAAGKRVADEIDAGHAAGTGAR